jgi:hypothetical protein
VPFSPAEPFTRKGPQPRQRVANSTPEKGYLMTDRGTAAQVREIQPPPRNPPAEKTGNGR